MRAWMWIAIIACAGCPGTPGDHVPERPSIVATTTLAPTPWWESPGDGACPPLGNPPQPGHVVRTSTDTYCQAAGVAHGPATRFYLDGRVAETGMMDRGQRVGPWTSYYPDGTLEAYGTYTNGVPTGVWSRYYPSGRASERGELAGTERRGLWLSWQDTGALVRDPDSFIDYHDGQPTMHGEFRDGEPRESLPVCVIGFAYPGCRFLPIVDVGARQAPDEGTPVRGKRGSATVEIGGLINLDPHHSVGLAAGWVIDATYPSYVVEGRYRYWLLDWLSLEGSAGRLIARDGIADDGWHASLAVVGADIAALTFTAERNGGHTAGLLGVRIGLPTALGAIYVAGHR